MTLAICDDLRSDVQLLGLDIGPSVADDNRLKAAETIDALYEALKPFADFANLSGAEHLPDDHVITLGSGMAARQLTMGDCRKARAALTKAEER